MVKISKGLLISGIFLAALIIIIGIINTNKETNIKYEKVDYVASTNEEIKQLNIKLDEMKGKLTEETQKLSNRKAELIAKGIKEPMDYNDGEAYELYILNDALDPGFSYCLFDKIKNNELTKQYCSLIMEVEDTESTIKTKEKYISSGQAEEDTISKK